MGAAQPSPDAKHIKPCEERIYIFLDNSGALPVLLLYLGEQQLDPAGHHRLPALRHRPQGRAPRRLQIAFVNYEDPFNSLCHTLTPYPP
jgi:hypothetical protein